MLRVCGPILGKCRGSIEVMLGFDWDNGKEIETSIVYWG